MNAVDICDPSVSVPDWPLDKIASNVRFASSEHVKYTQVNVTRIEECTLQCCASSECNYAYLKDMNTCYMVQCLATSEECQLVDNEKKTDKDPIDYLILIKASSNIFSLEEFKISPILSLFIKKGEPSECSETNNSSCPLNEICLKGKCTCPKELNYMKIDNMCREYLHKSPGCSMFMSECKPSLNEECIALNPYSRHGTCQCKSGYKRNLETFACEEYFLSRADLEKPRTSKRKRPTDLKASEDAFLDEIIKDLEPETTTTTMTTTTSK